MKLSQENLTSNPQPFTDSLRHGAYPAGIRVPDPIFLLAPPRSFTSVICAMMGQHPEMYGLLETSLFCAETLAEWAGLCEHARFPMAHGLLRTVAELIFGGQTEANVQEARGWLRRRGHCTTGYIFELLAGTVAPRVVVEKSPSMVYRIESLRRTRDMFPNARYIHLVRHPRGHGESVMKHLRTEKEGGAVPGWLLSLAAWPGRGDAASDQRLDPQHSWLHLHRNITEFLNTIPESQYRRMRSEYFLACPDQALCEILEWLELTTDPEAINQMKHPERWPYACLGPQNARFGTDRFFLESPTLRPERVEPLSLDGPLSWRSNQESFHPEVIKLATDFGYV